MMNEKFVNIKVDREERPDIDRIYQTAQYILTQKSGGWPLTMFLSPDDHIPFFGGTYFPPTARHGLPGFKDLLLRVAEFYQQEQEAIKEGKAHLNAYPDDYAYLIDAILVLLQAKWSGKWLESEARFMLSLTMLRIYLKY